MIVDVFVIRILKISLGWYDSGAMTRKRRLPPLSITHPTSTSDKTVRTVLPYSTTTGMMSRCWEGETWLFSMLIVATQRTITRTRSELPLCSVFPIPLDIAKNIAIRNPFILLHILFKSRTWSLSRSEIVLSRTTQNRVLCIKIVWLIFHPLFGYPTLRTAETSFLYS